MQQTRVEQGTPYYERFLAAYPTLNDLAKAPDNEVFKLWEGLGYYSRARNLLAAARKVATMYGGQFPNDYVDIRALPGVGDYTAAAVASFAFGLPYAVLDGNVTRVITRYWGIDTPVDGSAGKKVLSVVAQNLLDLRQPAAYNQAIMDFGATHCTPRAPRCNDCPLFQDCVAGKTGEPTVFPVKSKKQNKKSRFFLFIVPLFEGETVLLQRTESDIWQDLYTPPSVECTDNCPTNLDEALEKAAVYFPNLKKHFSGAPRLSGVFRQTLTHREVYGVFLTLPLDTHPVFLPGFQDKAAVTASVSSELPEVAMPRMLTRYWLSNHSK